MSKFVIQQDVAIGLGNGFVVTDTLTDKLTSEHTLMFTRQMIETLALDLHPILAMKNRNIWKQSRIKDWMKTSSLITSHGLRKQLGN